MTRKLVNRKNRNAEYFNQSKTFDRLYQMSRKGNTFHDLYAAIFSSENIQLAYRNIRKNSGSITAGVDGQNIGTINRFNIGKVVQMIQRMAQNYKPSKVRRT